MPDTFFFLNNVSVSAEIDVDVTWKAQGRRVRRGTGASKDPQDWGAFKGHFAEATCTGKAKARETGFSFGSGKLDAKGFFAQMGTMKNGAFL